MRNKKQILAVGAAWLMALGMIGCQTAAPDPTETTGELLAVVTDATEPEKEAFVSSSRYQATLPTEPPKPTEEAEATEPAEGGTAETSTPGTGTGSTGSSGTGSSGNGNSNSGNPAPTTPTNPVTPNPTPTPSPTVPPATEAPTEPAAAVCSHNWQEVWHDEVGHYGEPYKMCNCGFVFDTFDEWAVHQSGYSSEEVLLYHTSWSSGKDYIIDVPGYSTWVCSKCGATSDTQP